MLSYLIRNTVSKRRPSQTKAAENREKEPRQELAQDQARADDDGFANAKEVQWYSFTKESR